jgi:hypothetical protein
MGSRDAHHRCRSGRTRAGALDQQIPLACVTCERRRPLELRAGFGGAAKPDE